MIYLCEKNIILSRKIQEKNI